MICIGRNSVITDVVNLEKSMLTTTVIWGNFLVCMRIVEEFEINVTIILFSNKLCFSFFNCINIIFLRFTQQSIIYNVYQMDSETVFDNVIATLITLPFC